MSISSQRTDRRKDFAAWNRPIIRLLCCGLALLPLLYVLAGCSRNVTVVGILEDEVSPRVDGVREGFLESMTAAGFKAGDNARYIRYNAVARKLPVDDLALALVADEKARLILVLSPEGLTAAQAATAQRGAPVVFALSGSNAASRGRRAQEEAKNVTGVVAPSLEGDLIALLRRALPSVTRIAVLFDPSEPASQASATQVQAAAGRAGLTPLMVTYNARLGKTAALSAIDQGARAIYLVPGRTLEAAFPAIIEVTNAGAIPVFAGQEDLADRGALAALQVDWEDSGRRAGDLAARVLRGEPSASLPVLQEGSYRLVLSQEAARRLRVILPPDLVATASRVVD